MRRRTTGNDFMKTEIAKRLYETYCAAVGGKAFNGDPLPGWEEFSADEKKKLQSDAWLELGALVESQIKTSTEIFTIALEAQYKKLALERGDILLATVPKNIPLTPHVMRSLQNTFNNLLHDKGVRVLIKNEDIGFESLADLLTADDLARMAARIERKKLEQPVAPVQAAGEPLVEKLNVILNGKPAKCDREVTYEQIIVAAGYEPDRIISVTYSTRRNGDSQRSGMLSPGKKVLVEEGMVFNAMDTSAA
jgi:hypothetical protein